MTLATAFPVLPNSELVGKEIREWELPLSNSGRCQWIVGKFIGFGTSGYDSYHSANHAGVPWAPQRVKCSYCRWAEIRIFREDGEDGKFHVYRVGMSRVPGEVPFYNLDNYRGPYEVVEALTSRRTNRQTGLSEPHLAYVARMVLAQAANYDDRMNDAFINRAVD